MRRIYGIAAVLLLAGAVCSGCSAGASGTEDPDLVVYNDSTAILGSISVSGEGESQSVSLADDTLWSGERATASRWTTLGRCGWSCGTWMGTRWAAAGSIWGRRGCMSLWRNTAA